jgi:hypothetical protein
MKLLHNRFVQRNFNLSSPVNPFSGVASLSSERCTHGRGFLLMDMNDVQDRAVDLESRLSWAKFHFTHYGLGQAEYAKLLLAQKYVCAICGGVNKAGRALVVDHCHKNGTVRGLLCGRCNTKLGSLRDDTLWMRKAAAYLTKKPKVHATVHVPNKKNYLRRKEMMELWGSSKVGDPWSRKNHSDFNRMQGIRQGKLRRIKLRERQMRARNRQVRDKVRRVRALKKKIKEDRAEAKVDAIIKSQVKWYKAECVKLHKRRARAKAKETEKAVSN